MELTIFEDDRNQYLVHNEQMINHFWQEFLSSRSDLAHLRNVIPDAWSFGGDADLLLRLVMEGKKTATSSLLSVYRDGTVPLPVPGSYSIILDSQGVPKCVVLLLETFIFRFKDVNEKHAFDEGEGDRTLEYWRKVHLAFFSSYGDFNEESEILGERFKVVS